MSQFMQRMAKNMQHVKQFVLRMMEPLLRAKFRTLDVLAPLEVRIRLLFYSRKWVLHIARSTLRNSITSAAKKIVRSLSKNLQPDKWFMLLIIVAGIIFLPQIILYFIPSSIFSTTSVIPNAPSQTYDLRELLNSYWQVLAATLGLSLVIVVFLIEFIQDRSYEMRIMPLFVAKTGIILIVNFGLLTLISMGLIVFLVEHPFFSSEVISRLVGFNLLLFAINIFLVIYLYSRTFQFISPRVFKSLLLSQNRNVVISGVEDELHYRIAGNILRRECEKLDIELSIFRPSNNSRLAGVRMPIRNWDVLAIDDVNLGLLGLIGRRIKALADFYGETEQFFLYAVPRTSRISGERPEIAFVPSYANRPMITVHLLKSLKTTEPSKYAVEEENLQISRDILSGALRDSKVEVVEEILAQYHSHLHYFLETLDEYGLKFSVETAINENSWISEWPFVSKIRRQYADLIGLAAKSEDDEVFRKYIIFLYRVMGTSLDFRDHLVFQQFVLLHPHVYFIAKKENNPLWDKTKISRCWGQLIDFYNYRITPILEDKSIDRESIIDLVEYTKTMAYTFNILLKQIIDFRDVQDFKRCVRASSRLCRWGENKSSDLENLEFQLSIEPEPAKAEAIVRDIEREKTKINGSKEIVDIVNKTLFGLGGWLVDLLREDEISIDEFNNHMDEIAPNFNNLESLREIYMLILQDSEPDKRFGWDWWETKESHEPSEEPIMKNLNSSKWLGMFYAFRALQLSPHDLEGAPMLHPVEGSKGVNDIVVKNIGKVYLCCTYKVLNVQRHQNQQLSHYF